MALQGDCIYYSLVDTGETQEVNVIHPDGTEEVITQPLLMLVLLLFQTTGTSKKA